MPCAFKDASEGRITVSVLSTGCTGAAYNFPLSIQEISAARHAKAGFTVQPPARILVGSAQGIEHLIGMPIAVLKRSEDIDAFTAELLSRTMSDLKSRVKGSSTYTEGSEEWCSAIFERELLKRRIRRLQSVKDAIIGHSDTYFTSAVILSQDHKMPGFALGIEISQLGNQMLAAANSYCPDAWYCMNKEMPFINLGNSAFIALSI